MSDKDGDTTLTNGDDIMLTKDAFVLFHKLSEFVYSKGESIINGMELLGYNVHADPNLGKRSVFRKDVVEYAAYKTKYPRGDPSRRVAPTTNNFIVSENSRVKDPAPLESDVKAIEEAEVRQTEYGKTFLRHGRFVGNRFNWREQVRGRDQMGVLRD